MSDKKKYIVTDGKKIWYSNTVVFDEASGVLELDEGRRMMINPVKFKFFEVNEKKGEEQR